MFQHPLFKIPFRYGLIGGVIACIVLASLYYMGQHPFLVPWIIDFRIIFFSIFIFLSLKEARDFHLNKNLTFSQGMIGGYVFIFITGLMGAILTWCLATWDANFLSTYILKATEQLKNFKKEMVQSFNEQDYELQLTRLQSTSAITLATDYLLNSLIIGLFLTPVISIILRKQTKPE